MTSAPACEAGRVRVATVVTGWRAALAPRLSVVPGHGTRMPSR